MYKAKTAIILAVITVALSLLVPLGAASSGLSDNTVVTKSYVDGVYVPALAQYGITRYRDWFAQNPTGIEKAIGQAGKAASGASVDELALLVLDEVKGREIKYAPNGTVITLSPGQTLIGGQGTMACVSTGTVYTAGQVADFTTGADLSSGVIPPSGHRLCFVQDGGLSIISSTKLEIFGYYRVIPSPRPKYGDIADALFAMGLFAGTNNGYELQRPATRIEILVMLIKLLGENDAATSYKGTHPFSDVPAWANAYVAYAYSKGYTAGTSATTFSPNSLATGNQYAAFVLKALGYDSNSDFSWSSALRYAGQRGIISEGEISLLDQPFLRDKMVYLSYYSLFAKNKSGESTMLQGLVSAGRITQKTADDATSSVVRTRP